MANATIKDFGGLDLQDDPQTDNGALDMLNVDLDNAGRVRTRDGYLEVTTSAGATRYDSIFAVAGAVSVSSSAKFPGTGADDSSFGALSWSSTGNIFATDNAYATASGSDNTHYLKATNFGFAIPGTATVVGVVAEVVGKASATTSVSDRAMRLVKGGVIGGSEARAARYWTLTNSTSTFGTSSSLWGNTLTAADVNGATFGCVLSVTILGGATASIDSIKLTVYYLPLANALVAGASGSRLDVIDSSGAVGATLATASDTVHSYVAFGSPTTSAVYIANSGTVIRKLVGTTFSTPAGMPKAKFVGLQSPSNRLVAANIGTIPTGASSTASTSLVHFSDENTPETWTATNYVYLGAGDNEDIQGLVTWRNNLLIFKSSRFWVFYGNSPNSDGTVAFNRREVTGAGMVAPQAVAASPDGVYFLDRRGVYFTTGGPPQRVSGPIDPLFQGGADSTYQTGIVNPSAIGNASMCWFNDRLYVGLPLGSATTNDHTLVFDPQTRQWQLWDIPMGAMTVSASQPGRLLFTYAQGTFDIGQYAQNAYTDDNGSAIAWRYRLGFQDFGTPDSEKALRALLLSGVGAVSVKTAVNDTATLGAATTVTLGTSPAVGTGRAAVGVRGRNVSVEVSGSGPCSLSHLSFDIAGERAPGVRAA